MDSTRETYSSFDGNLRDKFLLPLLDGAVKYDRVAGYLSSSILALADEVYEMVDGKIRIVCNDDLKPEDVLTAYASKVKADLFDYFQQFPDIKVTKKKLEQLKRFQKLLEDDRLENRVVGSNDGLGFIHAKMGVVTKSDGSQIWHRGFLRES